MDGSKDLATLRNHNLNLTSALHRTAPKVPNPPQRTEAIRALWRENLGQRQQAERKEGEPMERLRGGFAQTLHIC